MSQDRPFRRSDSQDEVLHLLALAMPERGIIMGKFREEVLNQLTVLIAEITEVKQIHERMLAEHKQRIRLLDSLVKDQNKCRIKLNQLLDSMDNDSRDSDWWKRGEKPE